MGQPTVRYRLDPWTLAMAALATCIGCGGAVTPSQAVKRPNIVLFVADDHGQWAAGCYGNQDVATPNLDRLAAEGILIRRATSPGPVCSPARASLLTGRLPSQHGIHDFLSESPVDDRDWLEGEVMLQELLQRAGYRTALVGKWHLRADSRRPQPGFDRWVSYDVGVAGWQNQYLHEGSVHLSDQGRPIAVEGRQTEHLVRMALEFVDEGDERAPFFLLIAPTDTHGPFKGAPRRWIEAYQDSAFASVPRGETSLLPVAAPRFAAPIPIEPMLAEYFAAVSFQDDQLGVLLDGLAQRRVLDETLVVYTSDHGHMNGHHGLVGKANATLPQNLYEETIRVPMVFRWPSGFEARGEQLDIPFDHLDLFQTVLDAADISLSEATRRRINSPGRSLVDWFGPAPDPWRSHQFTEHGNARLVSDGRYKLIRRYPPLEPRYGDEFYDLTTDPRETSNRIGDPHYQGVIERLGRVLDSHFGAYEEAGKSGRRILEMPAFNGREPWRRIAERLSPSG